MHVINDYFNPFSNHFQDSTTQFSQLSGKEKTVAIISAIAGAIFTPMFLFFGAFAGFQLAVHHFSAKQLHTGDNQAANQINDLSNEVIVNSTDSDSDQNTEVSYPQVAYSNRMTYSGPGKYTQNGTEYVGVWNDGVLDGKSTNAYGDRFEGTFFRSDHNPPSKNRGTLTFKNGDVFEGSFKDDRIFDGTYTQKKDDCVFKGEFNEKIKSIYRSTEEPVVLKKGTITKDKNTYSVQECLNNDSFSTYFSVSGVIRYANKDVFEGQFSITLRPDYLPFEAKKTEGKLMTEKFTYEGQFIDDEPLHLKNIVKVSDSPQNQTPDALDSLNSDD